MKRGASWSWLDLFGSPTRLVIVLCVFAALGVAGGLSKAGGLETHQGSTSTTSPSGRPSTSGEVSGRWDGRSPSREEINADLALVDIIRRSPLYGYDRECGSDHACSFGQAWTDDTAVPTGHNGCDQRNDVLRASLEKVTVKPGTHGCVVLSGTLQEPYTGQQITFSKSQASLVQIDHIYPLARAWDMGAAEWSLEQRIRFATDPINLIAVDGSSNASKGDQGPGEWMPINRAYRCAYVDRYLEVAIAYSLPITPQDEAAIHAVGQTCPQQGQPSGGRSK